MRPKKSVLTSTIMSLRQFICNVFALETIVSIGLGVFFYYYLFVYLVGNSIEGQTWDKGNSRQMFLPSLPLLIFNFHKFKANINNILVLKQAEIIEHLNLALYFTQFSRLDF